MIAGEDHLGEARFQAAGNGKRWVVDATTGTAWHFVSGPPRRLRFPEEVPAGQGMPAFLDTRYVARSQRIVEGQYLWVVGFAHDNEGVPTLLASEITDEDHAAILGPLEVGRVGMQGGGLA